ncbi:MAG: ABC transporter ATP-binding protein [Eubacteriales bacterium]
MLELKDISFRYSRSLPLVLSGINLRFEKGRMYGITGRSGSGKTTLISLIAGLDKPSGGQVLYGDKDISLLNLDKYRSQSVGVIFQSYNLILKYSALENVLISLYLGGCPTTERRDRAAAILDSVGITGELHSRSILSLSGGEQQRVAIARAIAGNPDVIIADEPTGNLDGENQQNIMEILKRLSVEGRCVIVVSHSDIIKEYADSIIRLDGGKVTA